MRRVEKGEEGVRRGVERERERRGEERREGKEIVTKKERKMAAIINTERNDTQSWRERIDQLIRISK